MAQERSSHRIAVLGAGAFGTALACLLARQGKPCCLWARSKKIAQAINQQHQHPTRLKEVVLPNNIVATNSLTEALTHAQLVLSALPMHALQQVWQEAAVHVADGSTIVSTTKGIAHATMLLGSDVIEQALAAHNKSAAVACLSGPSFAIEVAKQLPTAVTVAAAQPAVAQQVQQQLSTDRFRCYSSSDMRGLQLAAALKNVVAIASGIAVGLQLGHNAQAALVSRGLAEMVRLGSKLGADRSTFYGLGGIGDLVLTCTGSLSRNRCVGVQLAQGKSLQAVLRQLGEVAEGVHTARSIAQLSEKHGVAMPICEGVCRVLFEQADARKVVGDLLRRQLKQEAEPTDSKRPTAS
ncbi:MAG: NAD(P)H-dependent glycerol-3-phosphate dehydrogenase [Myxococcota bacterium]